MTQNEKDLLLKDLCARLPYGVKMNHIADDEHSPKTLIGVAKDMITLEGLGGYESVDVENYKPYLFPLSSMAEEQQEEFDKIYADDMQVVASNLKNRLDGQSYETNFGHFRHIDWLNKNHFDYRGLIPIGLAINATGLNIY
jgi:hypothetical protein